MRRLAQGSSVQSFDGSGSAGSRLDGRSLATRGAFGKGKGSGAPSRGRLTTLFAQLAVAASLLGFSAAPALAANPPKVSLGITIPSSTALTWATLGGTVNPEGQATTYLFEYGKTSAYGDKAPAVAVSAGSGSADVPVTRAISGLELNMTYHYRLVATNATGTTNGPDLTFTTGPNLGFGMHYELVSPADPNGSEANPSLISTDGNRINYIPGKQAFGGAESQHGVADIYLGTRTASGWETTSMNPAQDVVLGNLTDTTADLGTQMAETQTQEQFERGAVTPRLVRPGDLHYKAFPELRDLTGTTVGSTPLWNLHYGASDDLSHLYVSTTRERILLPTDVVNVPQTPSAVDHLYDVTADPPAIRSVTLDNFGNNLAPVCMASDQGGYATNGSSNGRSANSISADGSKIFFSAQPGTPVTSCAEIPKRVYARINAAETVEISASECQPACASPLSDAFYAGATNDGSKVAFMTNQQLLNADTDASRDLYLYDFAKPAGQHLSLASKGDATDPTPGNGAQIQNIVNMSDDGSHIYFVAAGVLTTGLNSFGQGALGGANNLYLYEPGSGKTAFIARLDASDADLWLPQQITNNQLSDATGRILLMGLKTQVGPGDTDAVTDLYRFDAQARQIIRVTPGNTADAVESPPGGYGNAAVSKRSVISADGSTIAFGTAASLQSSDTNGVRDLYLWREGTVSLIGAGSWSRGVSSGLVSTDGDEVVFSTAAKLVPKDANSSVSTYVARTGPDVEPPIVPPAPPCDTSALCRGPVAAVPAIPAQATAGFFGEGNLETPAPQKKANHKKKHHKKKQQKHRARKHSTRRAG